MMEQSIRELVERAKMGDQQAIAALYEKTSRKAYYLSLQLVKDQDQAQDILQECVFEGVYQSEHAAAAGEFSGLAGYDCD